MKERCIFNVSLQCGEGECPGSFLAAIFRFLSGC